jgi:hypothetical protein
MKTTLSYPKMLLFTVMGLIWMARSHSITFIFVSSRVGASLPFFQQMSIETFTGFLWFMLVFSLLVPDLLINGKLLLSKPHQRYTTPAS